MFSPHWEVLGLVGAWVGWCLAAWLFAVCCLQPCFRPVSSHTVAVLVSALGYSSAHALTISGSRSDGFDIDNAPPLNVTIGEQVSVGCACAGRRHAQMRCVIANLETHSMRASD